ncbi:MAG TPA: putative porin [Chthoniobacterales bacterium]|nr:putative porin [Chthoniobacterales bacterium]
MFKKIALITVLAVFLSPSGLIFGQDDSALLNLLVKKKIITEKEATEVRAELKKEAASRPAPPAEGPTRMQKTYDGKTYVEKEVPVEKTAAEKWKLSTPITEIELFGDVRLRYSYNGGQSDDNSPLGPHVNGIAGHDDWQERERERYRIRLGLKGTLLDDWLFGIRLETGTSPRSTNVTFGDDTAGNGPFAKVSDSINVGQAYIGYKGFKDFMFTGGKMPNPLVNTPMVWDPDINPEGLAEQWKHTFSFGETGGEIAPYGKDGKNVVAVKPQPLVKLDIFVNLAQFVYDDANPENPLGPRATTTGQVGRVRRSQLVPNTDAFLMAWQVGAKATFPKGIFFQVAPTIYNYTGNGDTFNIHYQGGSPFVTNAASLAQNQTGINSLLIFDMPMEFGWKLWNLPMHLFGDFSANFEGDQRANAAAATLPHGVISSGHGDQRYAFQAGAGVGQLKKKHDWQLDVYYQLSEQYALDPNLVDDDIFDGRQNMEGVVVKAGYMLSDAVSVNFSYNYGWRHDDNLGTGGTAVAIGINPLDQYQLFFADLNIKF